MNKTTNRVQHLLNDECRCHDADCPERETCLRWVDREYGDHRRLYSHSPSLFPYDIPLGEKCPVRIPVSNG